jgi:hypothetical protein
MLELTGRVPVEPPPGPGQTGNYFHWTERARQLIRAAGAEIAPGDRAGLVAELAGWPEDDRRAAVALSVASAAPEPLLDLLGHADALPLTRIVRAGTTGSPAPVVGAADLAEIRAAYGSLTSIDIDGLCDLLRESVHTIAARLSGGRLSTETTAPDSELVRAVMGLNRDDVTARVRHYSHTALAAFGALPATAEDTVADRLELIWWQLGEISRQRLRADRWRSHVAGARCALAHLSQIVGRAEVAAALAAGAGGWVTGDRATVIGREWTDGPYRATVEETGVPGAYDVLLWRGRRLLLDAPKAFRGSAALAEARMAQASITRWL